MNCLNNGLKHIKTYFQSTTGADENTVRKIATVLANKSEWFKESTSYEMILALGTNDAIWDDNKVEECEIDKYNFSEACYVYMEK